MDLNELTPARILLARYVLEARLTSPGSTSGHQAERLRAGLGGAPQEGGRVNVSELLRARLADLLLLCRGLSEAEEKVCRARYAAAAGVLPYTAIRRLADMRDGDGEEVADVRPHDLDGKPMDGYVQVRGLRTRYPSNAEIAQKLGLTARQVQRHLEDARAKIAESIRWHAYMHAQQARYE